MMRRWAIEAKLLGLNFLLVSGGVFLLPAVLFTILYLLA